MYRIYTKLILQDLCMILLQIYTLKVTYATKPFFVIKQLMIV